MKLALLLKKNEPTLFVFYSLVFVLSKNSTFSSTEVCKSFGSGVILYIKVRCKMKPEHFSQVYHVAFSNYKFICVSKAVWALCFCG